MKPDFKKIAASTVLSDSPNEIMEGELENLEECINIGTLTLWEPFEDWDIKNVIDHINDIEDILEEAYNEGLKQKEI